MDERNADKAKRRERRNYRGRRGSVNPAALASFLGTAIIISGVSYAYDEYVGVGEKLGTNLALKAGLGTALMQADSNEALGLGRGLLPGRVFDVIVKGRVVHVNIVQNRAGEKYITAWYTENHWGLLTGSYQEVVDVITIKDNYRVYNVR